jgi:hypothetical protein
MKAKDIKPYIWNKEPDLSNFTPLKKYDLDPSLSSRVDHCQTAVDFFDYFINEEMLDLIVHSTNSKIASFSADKNYFHKNTISEVDRIEIRSYIGLLLLFGVLKKNNVAIEDLWSEDNSSNIHSCYWAKATMSRDRFKVISRCITFDEIESREVRKNMDLKFYKMRSLFEMFRENIRACSNSRIYGNCR